MLKILLVVSTLLCPIMMNCVENNNMEQWEKDCQKSMEQQQQFNNNYELKCRNEEEYIQHKQKEKEKSREFWEEMEEFRQEQREIEEKNNKKRQEESHCAVNNFKVVKLDKVLKHWNEMTGNDNYYKIVSQNDKYVYEFYMDGKLRKTESIDKICRKYVQNESGYKMR